jgi:predicted Zn-dependent peptidase
VPSFTQEMIADFRRTRMTTDNMVLSIVGDLPAAKVHRLAEKFLGHAPSTRHQEERLPPPSYKPFDEKLKKDFTQTHCMMGMPAYGKHEEKRFGLTLINNILGGSGMSARLSMAVREKHGLTYHIGSHYGTYSDTGVFSIYFATDKKYLGKCRTLIEKELKKMREIKLTPRQLKEAKTQLLGHIAIIEENQSVHMQSQARSLLDHGELRTFKDFLREVDKVTAEEVLEISNEIFAPERVSTLVYESE